MKPRTWDEWRALRDELVAAERADKSTRAIARMLARHGRDAQGRSCGDCAHLRKVGVYTTAAGGYWKCTQYGVTGGAGTDWRVSWPACGLFAAPELPA